MADAAMAGPVYVRIRTWRASPWPAPLMASADHGHGSSWSAQNQAGLDHGRLNPWPARPMTGPGLPAQPMAGPDRGRHGSREAQVMDSATMASQARHMASIVQSMES
jgi:hypothetical protein